MDNMTPRLPKNSWTITPQPKPCLTAADVLAKYTGADLLSDRVVADAREDLNDLQDYDNYFRETDPDRQEAKKLLYYLLAAAGSAYDDEHRGI